ncbi:MAG: methyltransferase domain-containing protein, partial [Elusimicrobiota bacterium]
LHAALEEYKKVEALLEELLADPTLQHDKAEAIAYHAFVENERRALQYTLQLRDYHDFLLNNDEPQKAALLGEVLPHQQAHGVVSEYLRRWRQKVDRHIVSAKAYADFYNDDAVTGAIPSQEEGCLAPMVTQQWRIRYAATRIETWLQKHPGEKVKVLDYGCFDGLSAIPLLAAIGPERLGQYIAMDIKQDALDRFKARLERFPQLAPFKDKVLFVHGDEDCLGAVGKADLVVCMEVIEHVQMPGAFLDRLLRKADPEQGEVVISTPWGSFDKGLPPGKTAWGTMRDERGHLRAMLPRDMVEMAEQELGRVVDMETELVPGGLHASFCASIKPITGYSASYRPKAASFYVPAALWDWNASHVYRTGIGASEETIVYLARELAKNDRRAVSVYGPLPTFGVVPGEEVKDRVAYWPNEQLYKVQTGKLIVSRYPSLGVKAEVGEGVPKILWLQDAVYPDLTPEIADAYERIVVVSDWHKQAMHERHGVPLDKMSVAYNFLLKEHFRPAQLPERQKHRFIYASSPDRGLLTLLQMWPEIRKMWPDATLSIFYGWEGCKKLSANNPTWAVSFRKMWAQWEALSRQPGVENIGRVNHERIAYEMLRSDIWFYPSVEAGYTFEETGCSNASKARAAGCIPVYHPVAALNETAACDQSLALAQWAKGESFEHYQDRCLDLLHVAGDTDDSDRQQMMDEALEQFEIGAFMARWEEWLK